MIKRSNNIEEKLDFDDIVNDIEQEVETQHAEDGLINRVPDLKQLSENIEKRLPLGLTPPFNWSLPSVSIIRLGQS